MTRLRSELPARDAFWCTLSSSFRSHARSLFWPHLGHRKEHQDAANLNTGVLVRPHPEDTAGAQFWSAEPPWGLCFFWWIALHLVHPSSALVEFPLPLTLSSISCLSFASDVSKVTFLTPNYRSAQDYQRRVGRFAQQYLSRKLSYRQLGISSLDGLELSCVQPCLAIWVLRKTWVDPPYTCALYKPLLCWWSSLEACACLTAWHACVLWTVYVLNRVQHWIVKIAPVWRAGIAWRSFGAPVRSVTHRQPEDHFDRPLIFVLYVLVWC